jgi:hypothetical protein
MPLGRKKNRPGGGVLAAPRQVKKKLDSTLQYLHYHHYALYLFINPDAYELSLFDLTCATFLIFFSLYSFIAR